MQIICFCKKNALQKKLVLRGADSAQRANFYNALTGKVSCKSRVAPQKKQSYSLHIEGKGMSDSDALICNALN